MNRFNTLLVCLIALTSCGKQEADPSANSAAVETRGPLKPREVAEAIQLDPNMRNEEVLKAVYADAVEADRQGQSIVSTSKTRGSYMSMYCASHSSSPACEPSVTRSIDWK